MKRLLTTSLLFLILAYIIPGVTVTSFWAAILLALVHGLLNWTVMFVLRVLTIPLNFITFGLTNFLLNGLGIYLASSFVSGFYIPSFWTAVFMAFGLSLLESIFFRQPKH